MFFPLYNGLKKRREPCVLGLSPLCYYKDTTFSAEIQIALTYRNSLRNVKIKLFSRKNFNFFYNSKAEKSTGKADALTNLAKRITAKAKKIFASAYKFS